mmetsp:Transcript_66840/g.159975  ORF Transcript_66840/g.159975 Transcript_66840/m.159975 type:complete len:241 (-) Transcript_66840:410-1132(-)
MVLHKGAKARKPMKPLVTWPFPIWKTGIRMAMRAFSLSWCPIGNGNARMYLVYFPHGREGPDPLKISAPMSFLHFLGDSVQDSDPPPKISTFISADKVKRFTKSTSVRDPKSGCIEALGSRLTRMMVSWRSICLPRPKPSISELEPMRAQLWKRKGIFFENMWMTSCSGAFVVGTRSRSSSCLSESTAARAASGVRGAWLVGRAVVAAALAARALPSLVRPSSGSASASLNGGCINLRLL